MKDKKHYWQQPDWDYLSPRRKYPWSISAPSDWQDVLSTYECMTDEADSPETTQPKPNAKKGS